jgi:hypothetical protein
MYLSRNVRNILDRRYRFLYVDDKDLAATVSDEEAAKIHDGKVLCYRNIKVIAQLFQSKDMEGFQRLFRIMFQYDMAEASCFLEVWDEASKPKIKAES